jgi:hypothetical protein
MAPSAAELPVAAASFAARARNARMNTISLEREPYLRAQQL